jgi:hypothetical protein
MLQTLQAKAELLRFFDIRSIAHPCAVTLTMKKRCLGQANDHMVASANYRHFNNRLCSRLLGSAAKRYGRRLFTIPVIEKNADERLHYHVLIGRPARCEFTLFEAIVRCEWERTEFGYRQMDVQDMATPRWTEYMLKFQQKGSLLDAVDWMNCHLAAE